MKQKKIKRLLLRLLSVVLLVLLLGFFDLLCRPKYMTSIREGALTAEYYGREEKHNLLFVGDCEVYEGFSPVTLYEEYGISTYIRGSAQQLIWQSYYLLREAFERGERPEAVVFNVLAMKYGTPQSESYNRMTIDGMPISKTKFEMIRASMTEEEDFLSYLFPLLRYHSRVTELKEEDFRYLFSRDEISYHGYLMQTGVKPQGEVVGPSSPYAPYALPEISFSYLDKMKELCDGYGAELILLKAPTNDWRYWWYEEWDAEVAAYAEENRISYYSLVGKEEEIGIDYRTDSYDGGVHLNVYGVEKLSVYFGRILAERHGLSDLSSDETCKRVYAELKTRYENEKNQ